LEQLIALQTVGQQQIQCDAPEIRAEIRAQFSLQRFAWCVDNATQVNRPELLGALLHLALQHLRQLFA
jgi:hypothetical protein